MQYVGLKPQALQHFRLKHLAQVSISAQHFNLSNVDINVVPRCNSILFLHDVAFTGASNLAPIFLKAGAKQPGRKQDRTYFSGAILEH